MNDAIDLKSELAAINEPWHPGIIVEATGQHLAWARSAPVPGSGCTA